MSLPSKLASERNQKALLELCSRPGNDICADCKARHPRWTSWNLGIFICVSCASIHRKIGTHISKVKSVTMDTWSNEQVENMKKMGNIKSNAIFNPNEVRHPPPPNVDDTSRDSELEKYIRSKYENRKFVDKGAFVASKLGPSRSASTVTHRSVSTPVANPVRSSTLATTTPSSISKTPTLSPAPISQSPLAQPPQPSTSRSVQQPRSVSQPLANPEAQKPQGGVWDDLVKLQDSTPASSLPLQYQQPQSASFNGISLPQLPMSQTGLSIGVNPTGLGLSSAQFQTQPFQQQQPLSAFNNSATPHFAPSVQLTPGFQASQSYGQHMFIGQPGAMASSVFHPQPQTAGLQIQAPQQQQQGFLTPSPSMMSAPVTQTQFLTPSPSQQMLSHSPQIQTNVGYMTPSPQPQMGFMSNVQSHSPAPMMTGMSMQQFGGGVQPMMQPQNTSLEAFSQNMMSPAQFQAGMMNGRQGAFNAPPFGAQQQQSQWGTF